jgi:hypothetical protein
MLQFLVATGILILNILIVWGNYNLSFLPVQAVALQLLTLDVQVESEYFTHYIYGKQ